MDLGEPRFPLRPAWSLVVVDSVDCGVVVIVDCCGKDVWNADTS